MDSDIKAIGEWTIREELSEQFPAIKAMGLRVQLHNEAEACYVPSYMACTYYIPSLDDIHIRAYVPALLGLLEKPGMTQENFRLRINSALQEEVIHAAHLKLTRQKFDSLPIPNRERLRSPYQMFQQENQKLFKALRASEVGSKLLVISAQLYYVLPNLKSPDQVAEHDLKVHGRRGYSIPELIRQAVQVKMKCLTSEEAKKQLWDEHGNFPKGSSLTALGNEFRHLLGQVQEPTLLEWVKGVQHSMENILQPELFYTPFQAKLPSM